MAIDPAYVAGFFDGEGSVILSRAGAEVRLTQNDVRPLLPIQASYGGRITKEKGRKVYTWRVCNWDGCIAFLRDVQPWLIVKAEQATLLVDHYNYCRQVYDRPFNAKRRKHFSPEEKRLRNEVKSRLHALKNTYRNVPVAGTRVTL